MESIWKPTTISNRKSNSKAPKVYNYLHMISITRTQILWKKSKEKMKKIQRNRFWICGAREWNEEWEREGFYSPQSQPGAGPSRRRRKFLDVVERLSTSSKIGSTSSNFHRIWQREFPFRRRLRGVFDVVESLSTSSNFHAGKPSCFLRHGWTVDPFPTL